jgi:hypothetical protein
VKRASCKLPRPNGDPCSYTLSFADHMEEWARRIMLNHAKKNHPQITLIDTRKEDKKA